MEFKLQVLAFGFLCAAEGNPGMYTYSDDSDDAVVFGKARDVVDMVEKLGIEKSGVNVWVDFGAGYVSGD